MLKAPNTYVRPRVRYTWIKAIARQPFSVRLLRARGCHERATGKRNMRDKNRDLDRWMSKLRAPYEGVFSQQRRRVRYRGVMKNQWSGFMEALCYNIKRLLVMDKHMVL